MSSSVAEADQPTPLCASKPQTNAACCTGADLNRGCLGLPFTVFAFGKHILHIWLLFILAVLTPNFISISVLPHLLVLQIPFFSDCCSLLPAPSTALHCGTSTQPFCLLRISQSTQTEVISNYLDYTVLNYMCILGPKVLRCRKYLWVFLRNSASWRNRLKSESPKTQNLSGVWQLFPMSMRFNHSVIPLRWVSLLWHPVPWAECSLLPWAESRVCSASLSISLCTRAGLQPVYSLKLGGVFQFYRIRL